MPRVLAGAVLISFAAVFVALAGVASAPTAFYRLAIGGGALLILALVRGERLRVERRFAGYVFLAGLAFAADLVIWQLSIYRVGPGIATLLPNFQVVLMAFAGWAIWRERLSRAAFVGIAIAVAGLILLLTAAPEAGHGRFVAGIGYGLGAALAYTLYLLFLRLAGSAPSRESPAFFIALISLLAAAVAAIWIGAREESFAVPFGMAWLWLALYGLACQAGGWFLISTGISRVPAALAGLLLLLQPTLTFVWDWAIFAR
ncbi:MAG: DMT family transporter, partial [Gammaproteobacteria bacterium]